MSKPNPGSNPASNEAVRSGCTCPEHDNHYGKGMPRVVIPAEESPYVRLELK